ncbi:YopJ family acetyltransferase [Bordetella sp. LUAb4]|uniref:YopJ family acetyltransferase n=1 Tax=Bordetella sp. LUAb4 TaxID=2843195 RepID=UPI001E64F0A4|nr:YopJ family acetyltransferase [Bordetella sp. LUAb4]
MFTKLPSASSRASPEVNTATATDDVAALDQTAVNKTWVGGNARTSKEASPRATITNSDAPPNLAVTLGTANPGHAPRAQILGAALVEAVLHLTEAVRASNGSLPQLEMSPEDKAELREHIGNIRQALAAKTAGEFRALTSDFGILDYRFMPRLIESANLSKPGLNLEYADTAVSGSELLKTAVENGVSSKRYIVNLNSRMGIHFCAVDYRLIDGIPSVIVFEPVFPQRLSKILEGELREVPKMRFLTVGMEIQRSRYDCGMFSLAFAKKLHKEQDWLKSLHVRNAAGELLLERDGETTAQETDSIISPPSLYKHSQTRERPAAYLIRNPDKRDVVVNKKNETLLEFQQRNTRNLRALSYGLRPLPDAVINFSIHEKRLREYERLARLAEAGSEGYSARIPADGSS